MVTRGRAIRGILFSALNGSLRSPDFFFRPRWEPVRRLVNLPCVQPFERIPYGTFSLERSHIFRRIFVVESAKFSF